MSNDDAAVTSEFADAVGLGQLKTAAGGRAPGAGRPHGGASSVASAPAASAWPPPPTPDPFKQLVGQFDFVVCKVVEMTTKVQIDPQPKEYMDQIADSFWPLAHLYGAGAERPSAAVLWTYALAALGGYVVLVYSQWQLRKPQSPKIEVVR